MIQDLEILEKIIKSCDDSILRGVKKAIQSKVEVNDGKVFINTSDIIWSINSLANFNEACFYENIDPIFEIIGPQYCLTLKNFNYLNKLIF